MVSLSVSKFKIPNRTFAACLQLLPRTIHSEFHKTMKNIRQTMNYKQVTYVHNCETTDRNNNLPARPCAPVRPQADELKLGKAMRMRKGRRSQSAFQCWSVLPCVRAALLFFCVWGGGSAGVSGCVSELSECVRVRGSAVVTQLSSGRLQAQKHHFKHAYIHSTWLVLCLCTIIVPFATYSIKDFLSGFSKSGRTFEHRRSRSSVSGSVSSDPAESLCFFSACPLKLGFEG